MVKSGMKTMTIMMLGILLLSSCEKLVTWDEFTLKKTRYDGIQLRTDGYYYQLTGDGIFQNFYCFYRNGVLLNMGGYRSTIVEMNGYVKQQFVLNNVNSSDKSCWGLFVINYQIIKFEHYYITDDINKRSYIREGTILNDSTFHITVSYRSDGSERREKDETYHFRAFSPKPDSTSNFVK